MKTILLTNDDGFRSPGLTKLRTALMKSFDVFTIAPAFEMSAVSMALTLNRPLRVEKIGENYYSVDGTPSDCVNIAIRKMVKRKPNFLVSGMNIGENLSADIIYSGTVGAATSGFFYDIPSLAVSLISDKKSYSKGNYDIEGGVGIVKKVLDILLTKKNLKGIFNMNIPFNNNGKLKITGLGNKIYKPDIVEREDPRGKKYFWIGTGNPESSGDEGTDIWAVKNKYISLTPLKVNLSCFELKSDLGDAFNEF